MKVPSAEYDNSICHFMIFLKQKACCNIKNINTPDVLFLFMTGFFDMIIKDSSGFGFIFTSYT